MRILLNAKAWLGLGLAMFLAPASYGACTYSISPTSRSHGYGAATNTVTVNAGIGCAWDVTNHNSWINILSGSTGTSTGTVSYSVSANPTINSRTGAVTIAGLTFTVQQDGLPCTYSVSPSTRNHGYAGSSNIFTVSSPTGCAWSLLTTSVWINFTGVTNSTGSNSVTYSVAANRTPVQRTGTVAVVDQTFTVSQSAAPCIYDLTPTNRLHGFAGSTGLVTVTITSLYGNCDWFVNNTNSWITITANPSGNGSGTFGYTVASNPNATPRTGSFAVWDQGFTVLQNPAPCSYSLTPTSSSPGADPETNVVTVTAVGGCAWGVTNTNSWITIALPTNGVGSGTVTYITVANPAMIGRTGVVSIAGQNFTVRQDAATCTYKLSPTNHIHGYGATTNSVNLSTLSVCAWNVVNTNAWVTILSPTNGLGGSDITYSLLQNGAASDRTGVVLIGGQSFSLTQHGLGCAISLSPTNRNHGYGAATNTITINIAPGCSWNVVNTNSWITILDATNGTGSNTITYAVAANPASQPRGGFVVINEDMVLITQSAAPCTYSIAPASFTQTAVPQTNTVNVTSPIGCNWTVSNTNSWIAIQSGTNGTGSTGVTYQVAANLNSGSRTGLLTVAGQLFSLIQNGVTCSYKLSPTNRTHGYSATTNTISVTVSNPCPWFVENTNSWLTILSGATGAGTGVVTYAVSANSFSPDDRLGSLVVGGQVCVITQHGVPCSYSVAPPTRTHGYGAASNSFNVITTNGCPWAVGNTNTWITITTGSNGAASETVGYTIDANAAPTDRIGVLTVDGQTFTVTQRAAVCSFTLLPGSRNHGYGAATNTINVSTTPGCGWPVSTTNSWITILSGTTGTGTGVVTYAVSANSGASARTGMVMIADQVFVLTQSGTSASFSFESIRRGATGQVILTLVGGPLGIWEIQASSDFTIWTRLCNVTNTTGRVQCTVSPNPSSKTFYRAMQDASLCALSLSPATRSHGYGATTNSVDVSSTGNCAWQVVNTNSWITILSSLTGTNNSTVTYSVNSNTNLASRSGTVLIGDQNFLVNQSAYLCTYKLSPTNRTHGFGANTGLVSITTGPNCAWTISTTNNWITITSPTNGIGNTNFTYTIAPNNGTTTRTGTVMLADQVLTLAQLSATDGFSFESISLNSAGAVTLKLNGGPPGIWELQSSANLANRTNWTKVADLTNTTGRVEYIVPGPAGNRRFYRAVLP